MRLTQHTQETIMLVKSNPKTAEQPKKRAADQAYDLLEQMIIKLELRPGTPVVEAELVARTGLGRTPLREALMRMSSLGLIRQLPRRGLIISDIEAAEHMSLIETRRVLERLIAHNAARRADLEQREEIIDIAEQMLIAAKCGDLDEFMQADTLFDQLLHRACRNPSAVNAVLPLVVRCRRFWYAFQHEGDIEEVARCHMVVARAVAKGNEDLAMKASDHLMDFLDNFVRRVIV